MTLVRTHLDVAGAVALALAIVALYSFWGSHILATAEVATPVAVEQKNLR